MRRFFSPWEVVGVDERPKGDLGWKAGAAQGLTLAFDFAGAVLLFWFLGRLVDNWLGTEPWAQLVGSVIGWVGGTLHVYYASQRQR